MPSTRRAAGCWPRGVPGRTPSGRLGLDPPPLDPSVEVRAAIGDLGADFDEGWADPPTAPMSSSCRASSAPHRLQDIACLRRTWAAPNRWLRHMQALARALYLHLFFLVGGLWTLVSTDFTSRPLASADAPNRFGLAHAEYLLQPGNPEPVVSLPVRLALGHVPAIEGIAVVPVLQRARGQRAACGCARLPGRQESSPSRPLSPAAAHTLRQANQATAHPATI